MYNIYILYIIVTKVFIIQQSINYRNRFLKMMIVDRAVDGMKTAKENALSATSINAVSKIN